MYCGDESGGVRTRDLDLSFLPERPLCSPMAVVQPILMSDFTLRILHLISHRLLEYPLVDLMVPVELVREDMFAHGILTVPVASLPVMADHRRHHSWESE